MPKLMYSIFYSSAKIRATCPSGRRVCGYTIFYSELIILLFPLFLASQPADTSDIIASGIEKLMAGNTDAALIDFNQALTINPKNSDAYFWIAETMMKTDDRKEAMKNYNKAVTYNPIHYKALKNRGKLKAFLGDNKGSVADFSAALKAKPDYSDALYDRGLSYYYLKLYKESIDDLTKVITINPNDQQAFFARGRAKYDSGDTAGGCADWSKAGELGYFEAYAKIRNYCNK